ncbi:MAG: OmpP1/FadL family transporter [Saprospiraceae bacterium]
MNKLMITLLISCFFVFDLSSQTIQDALRYSQLNSGGTARSIGTGGALSAFGGDFGTLSVNPAGIATYRKSSLMITPSLNVANTGSTFAETKFDDNRTNINLNNIGIVFSKTSDASDWKAVNFGIGTNRLTNNNQDFFYQGTTQGTIAERWQTLANGFFPDELYDFEEGIAYDVGYIFNPDPDVPSADYLIEPDGTQFVQKEQTINREGSINDLNLTLGGNYRHKLYIGASVGLPFVRYEEEKNYTETDINNVSPDFETMTFNENFLTTGVGFNAKLGIIYRMNQNLRIGASVHTPTFFNLSEQYTTSIAATYLESDGPQTYESSSTANPNFSYVFISPWRATGSVGFMFGKRGFISGDIEYVDYTSSQFELTDADGFEQDLNNDIENTLTSAVNIRVGGEARYGSLAVRGGVGYSSSPYQEGFGGINEGQTNVSFGIGLREKSVFLDLGFTRFMFNETYTAYSLTNIAGVDDIIGPTVENNISKTQFVGTIGFRF